MKHNLVDSRPNQGSILESFRKRSVVIITIGLGLIFGLLVLNSPRNAAIFLAGGLIVLALYRSPIRALAALIVVLPFSKLTFLNEKLLAVPGSRPFLLLGVFTLGIAVLNANLAKRMPKWGTVLSVLVLASFSIACYRSLDFIDMIGIVHGQNYTPVSYLLSNLVKQCVYILPCFLIAKFAIDSNDIEKVVDIVIWTLVIFSAYFLIYYVFKVPNKGDIDAVWEYVPAAVGIHKSVVGVFYIVCFPLAMARFFAKRDTFSIMGLAVLLATIILLYSRTAYGAVLIGVFIHLLISKRSTLMPVFAGIGFVLVFFVATSVLERASKGISAGEIDINEFSAGRVENMWGPLWEEYVVGRKNLIHGNGRTAINNSLAFRFDKLGLAGHPHNMYFEQLLDAGIIGLVIYFFLFYFAIRITYRNIKRTKDPRLREYLYAMIVATVGFMLSGVTQGTLFPNGENAFFWIVLGCIFSADTLIDQEVKQLNQVGSTAPEANTGGD